MLFTHSLAALAAEGIRVNCVCPGVVNTPMLRRAQGDEQPAWLGTVPLLEPEDIADGIVQLIADDTVAGRALRIARGLRDFAALPAFAAPRPQSA
jgi:15-hydroxyprostaglandin dehydrogenase (NAD)